jgi:hypothetical protein
VPHNLAVTDCGADSIFGGHTGVMPLPTPRTAEQRKADTIAKLQGSDADVWVATAAVANAEAYLVPLSLAWIDQLIVIALEPRSRTARNLAENPRTRLAIGPTRDLVMIDAQVQSATLSTELDGATGDAYVAQVGWDPRRESSPYLYIALRPTRVQAWREANELAGRTLMKDGAWLV